MEITQDLEPETAIIAYCDGETCNLSHDLALFLKDMGFMNVRVLVNGWTVWSKSRFPVEPSEG
jgi:3-mercaptopyruvate sulfurtransferase SseA